MKAHDESAFPLGASRLLAMKRRRRADKEAAAGPDEAGGGHAACRERAGELEARLAASEAALSEQGGRLASAATTEGELRASLAAAEAAAAEQGGRLAASESAAAELRAANEALARERAAVKGENAAALASAQEQAELAALGGGFAHLDEAVEKGRALRRDFGAELPPGILLHIMDRSPDRKCVFARTFCLDVLGGSVRRRASPPCHAAPSHFP